MFFGENVFLGENFFCVIFLKTFLDVYPFRLSKSTHYAALIWIHVLLDGLKTCFLVKTFFFRKLFFCNKKKTFISQINTICPLIGMFVFLDFPNQRNMRRWFGSTSYWLVQKHVYWWKRFFFVKTFLLQKKKNHSSN